MKCEYYPGCSRASTVVKSLRNYRRKCTEFGKLSVWFQNQFVRQHSCLLRKILVSLRINKYTFARVSKCSSFWIIWYSLNSHCGFEYAPFFPGVPNVVCVHRFYSKQNDDKPGSKGKKQVTPPPFSKTFKANAKKPPLTCPPNPSDANKYDQVIFWIKQNFYPIFFVPIKLSLFLEIAIYSGMSATTRTKSMPWARSFRRRTSRT